MHIPDGYLSPAAAAVMYGAAMPFWYVAARRVRKALTNRAVPSLALFAAFSFVLQMFNIPLPGGTTGHAVGGTLLAIVLGPWAAVLGMSVVLGIQAVFFGDGGVLTFGANAFNMAIVLPLVGYFVYKVISSNSGPLSPRRLAAAVVASYFGMIAASIFTGIELGIQPALFHGVDGTPLYSPYGLDKALPAMLVGHVFVAGPVEALVTGLVVALLQKTRSPLIGADAPGKKEGKLWLVWGALGLLAMATPLGLLASGTAWGEWGTEQLRDMGLGFIPQGLQRFEGWWPAPFGEYGISRVGSATGYVLSAMLGIAGIGVVLWLLGRKLARREGAARDSEMENRPREMKGEGFLTRNISGLTKALESVVVAEGLCSAPGMLQGLDPRIKAASFLLFIITAGLARSMPVLGAVFVLILALSMLSRVPTGFFLKRILLFMPLFTAVIALPALFITPGDPAFSLGGKLVITEQGLRTAGLLVLRVTDSMSFGVLLILTTRWTDILVALRWFRLPPVVVATLGMTYRYVFVVLHSANSMFLARKSRTVGSFSPSENRRWLARALTTTLAKSQHMSEEVYLAMVSRGYHGEVFALTEFRLRRRDLAWSVFTLASAFMLLWWNYL